MANSMRGGTNRRRSEEKGMGEDARGIDRMEGDETKRGHGGKKEEVKEREGVSRGWNIMRIK